MARKEHAVLGGGATAYMEGSKTVPPSGDLCKITNLFIYLLVVDPIGHAACGVELRALTCWDCGFESHRKHVCLSFVSLLCC
jgi:hypothetical protein